MNHRIFVIAERLKRQTRHADVLALCDYVLSAPLAQAAPAAPAAPVAPVAQATAPQPQFDRRAYMRDYMRAKRRKTA